MLGEFDEEIYMDKPARFLVEGQEGNVCKPLISLYGLKEAHKQWQRNLTRFSGFAMNEADLYMYYRFGD